MAYSKQYSLVWANDEYGTQKSVAEIIAERRLCSEFE